MVKTTIPSETVRILRSALLAELGEPAGQLEQASMAKDKERRPELFHDALMELNASCVMLGAVGWCEPADSTDETSAQIDFDVYRRVVLNAMRTKLMVERDFLAKRGDADTHTEAEQRGDIYEHARRDIGLIEDFLGLHDPTERTCRGARPIERPTAEREPCSR